MNISRLLIVILLFAISFPAISSTVPGDIPLSFPFFQSGQSSGIREQLMVGYGDWTTLDPTLEGLHPGIDFFPVSNVDQVLNPFDVTMYSIGAYYAPNVADYTGCIIGIGPEGSDYGWALEHLGPDPALYPFAHQWCIDYTRGTLLNPRMPIDTCCIYNTGVLRHTHVQWSHWVIDQFHPGGYIMPDPWASLENPFSYFIGGVMNNYDQVEFKAVWPEIWFLNDETNTGAFFLPDGIESYNDYVNTVGSAYVDLFQNVVYGAVDIVVSPFSLLNDYPDNSGCGVYSAGYEILRQNPISQIWGKTESLEGNWGYRDLFMADGQIEEPSLWVDIYEALFHDKSLFENALIISNSGAKDPSDWDHGWDNVWIDPSQSSWTTGICQGAWDTFLAIPDIWPNPPTQNSEAFFPDGRYAVRVTAVSHGSRDTGIDTLPVDDLSLRDPQVEGVVVDNFLPHIVRVAAYTWNPAADTCYKIYAGYWEDIDPSRQSMAEPEYPEQLRSELCALQSSNQIDALQSRYVFDLPESFSRSSIDHDYQAERNRLSRDNSDGTGYFEPGCCLDEGIGQDPVEFLLEEIARVENQQVFNVDTTRTFDYRVYGYLPMNVGNLVLQVFYSEPIMSDNFNQEEIPDNLYFTGTIGNLIKWTSLAHGEFERLPGSFQLPLTSDTTTNCDMEFDNTFFDSSYVVHYIFRGALPREYVGNIHLYIGNPDQRIGGSPRDLAGNALDSYPGTVAEPRSDYGQFSYTGFELGPDTNYFMYYPPDWKAIPQGSSPDSVIGLVGEDTIAVIHPAEIGLEDAWFIGDCDYWCGFWMYREVPDEYGFNVYVVKPDGSYIDHSFKTPYPVGGISYEENWFSFPGRLSPDSRYFWMTGCTINLINERSCAFAYCVDSKTGARIDDHPVCSGPCFWGPGASICCSTAEIVDIESDAVAEISYSYFKTLYNPDSGVEGTTYISPPGGSDANLSEDMCCTSYISSDAEEVIEILSNPVRETLGVRLVGEYGENYELLLYDISGRQILSESGILRDDESVLSVGVQNLPSGVYLLRIRTGDIEVVRTVSIIH